MHTPTDKTSISGAKESIGVYSKLVSLLREYIDIDKQLEQLSNLPEVSEPTPKTERNSTVASTENMKTLLDEAAREEHAAHQSLLELLREVEDNLQLEGHKNRTVLYNNLRQQLMVIATEPYDDRIVLVARIRQTQHEICNRDNKE